MEDRVRGEIGDLAKIVLAPDVALDDGQTAGWAGLRKMLTLTEPEIIDYQDRGARLQELIHEMGADEPSPAGDCYAIHRWLISPRVFRCSVGPGSGSGLGVVGEEAVPAGETGSAAGVVWAWVGAADPRASAGDQHVICVRSRHAVQPRRTGTVKQR